MITVLLKELEDRIQQCSLKHTQNDGKLENLRQNLARLACNQPQNQNLRVDILSFCMSQHPRLGGESLATHLPPELTHMISKMVCI